MSSPAALSTPFLPPPGIARWKAHLSLAALLQIFGDYYHFRHRAVTKRSLSPHRPRHSRLQREPQVSVALALLAPIPFCSERPQHFAHPHTLIYLSTSFPGKVAGAAGRKAKDQEGRVSGAHRPQVPPAVVPGMLPSWVLVFSPPLGGAVRG